MQIWYTRLTETVPNKDALNPDDYNGHTLLPVKDDCASVNRKANQHLSIKDLKWGGLNIFKILLLLGVIAFGMQNIWKSWQKKCNGNKVVMPQVLEGIPEPVLRPLPSCPPLNYIQNAWLEFDDLHNFEFHEALKSQGIPPRHVGGTVSLVEGADDQVADIKALILFGSSDQHMVRNVAISKFGSSLVVDSINLEEEEESLNFPKLCLTIDVYLFFKPKLELDILKVNVANLGVDVRRGVTTIVSERTNISTKAGNVACAEASTWESRETVIDVHSGSVSGVWALLDLLSINVQSGSVSIDVQPKEANKSKPLPAVFDVKAQSGSVAVKFPTATDIPHRDYRSDVFAHSGSVSGYYIHGTRTSLISRSGSLRADVLPFNASAQETTLITESYSGLTSINVMAPHIKPNQAMNFLQSRHHTQSGSLTLRYPRQWQGTVEGSVKSGSLSIRGEGVKIIKDIGVGPIRRLVAEKGKGDSQMHFESISGSAAVHFD